MKNLFPSRRKKPKIKLLCSFHGKFLHRPPSGKLRYTGGETRIISVERSISYFRLKSKVLELICCPNKYTHSFSLQYQISDSEISEEHSALVLIASDDDVRCMIDAYERLEFHGKHYRLWIFVCNDDDNENEYANLQKLEDIRFKKFDETRSLSCELGVGCNNNEIVGAKNRIHVKSGIVSFCEDDFVKNNSLAYYCGGQLGRDKVRKLVTSGHIVKSNEDSLRKVVLKQKMLAKQSPLSQSFGDGLGLAIEQAAMGIASFDDEYCGKPGISLSSEREAPLTCDSAYPSFLVSSYRSNAIDYKYNDDKFIDSRSCVYSVPSSVSHSRPLNPKDGNSGVGINAQKNNNCDSRYSIGVLPRPKLYSIMGCYDAMFETRSVEPGTFSNFNRENIMPRAVGSVTSTAGLAPLSYSNQLLGGLSTSSASYHNSYHGIRNHCFGQGDARNKRIYHHSRSHYSNFTEAGNHRNVRVDGRPWVGKFYPGIQSSPVISKQAQVVKSSHPAMLKSWSGSHNQQVEGDLQASDCILNNLTCSVSFPYGSEENLTEHSDLGLPQDIKPEPESQLSYHGPLTGMADQSRFALTDSKNFPGCTEDVNAQIDFLSSCFPNQHDATNYQGPNRPESECNAKISKADAICKSFSKHETGTQKLQDSIAPSIDLPLHNLSRLSLDDLKTSTLSTSSSSSSRETYVKLQPMALELMDEEHLGSSPHFQISPDKAMELHEENEQEAVIQQDVESALSIVEKEEIQKACNGSKVHGEIPTELATVYNHLATRELQTIKNSDLEYIKELGSGTYGTVFYGKWKGSDVAIKRLKPSCFNGGAVEENRLIADFWKEAYILGQLRHPNIVAPYGVVTDGPATNLATVTEFMVNGSLKQVFRRKDRTIDRRKRLILAMGAAFGMEYLHEKNIVHFDLKSHNLLVNMKDPQRPVCKIGDLGLSKIKQKTLVSGGVRGTIPWMAPELLSCQNLVTEKVDVYSFGIVMWELLTGEEPYANMRSHEIIAGIIKGTLRPEIPSWCDPAWRSLMEKCWSADVDNRPAFSEIAKELRIMAAAMNIK